MIKAVCKWKNGMVVVFDEMGNQMPEYQGRYEDVKEHILEDAPPGAIFAHGFQDTSELDIVLKEEW